MSCLVFREGTRPTAAEVSKLAAEGGEFTLSHDAGADGWVELLRDGLTFDLEGLAPLQPAPLPSMPRRYDLPGLREDPPREALILRPGPHLAGAERLLPVVRTVAAVAMALSELPGVEAVGWLPSKSLCSPAWFRAGVSAWLEGGPFPSLALAAIERAEDGALRSHGLEFLAGQDFRLTASASADGAAEADGRAAMRLADWLVANGSVASSCEVELPGIGTVQLDPGPHKLITARRQ
ncbi:MAG: hypothetical protein KGL48_08375 [Sphingomonadales bacterium]|nr:hypothetical protein [Sphingomonadales bacterium]MDE2568896.1 hypothetical protein [Sphingomonadales bacterium]